MFNRFVYIKLTKEWATSEGRSAVIAESGQVLPSIPGVLSCQAGLPESPDAAKGWDLCLVLRFASSEDIESYRVHPVHVAFLEKFLGPKIEAKRVWNFRMQELGS